MVPVRPGGDVQELAWFPHVDAMPDVLGDDHGLTRSDVDVLVAIG